jgi:hypothetical protein
MNESECDDFLNRRLDGPAASEQAALEQHLAACPACRDWHLTAQLLEDGLRTLPPVVPPPGLAGRIVAQVLAERRSRLRRRWWFLPAAAAACLLLTPLALSLISRQSPGVPEPPPQAKVPQAPSSPSVQRSVAEAGAAVANLTDRIADQTREQARLFLTATAPVEVRAALPEPGAWHAPFDPAAQSLRQASQGVSAGLETVTGSARRAVAYLVRELSPLEGGETGRIHP